MDLLQSLFHTAVLCRPRALATLVASVLAALLLLVAPAGAQTPTITISNSSPLPDGQTNSFYSQTFRAVGGTGFTFTQPAGTLPSGLTLDSAGTLSGYPDTAGVYTFDIKATDGAGASGTKTFQLTITQGLEITTARPLPTGAVGVPYSLQVTAIGGSGTGYVFSSPSTFPPGVTMDSAGLISGTPTSAGFYLLDFSVQDSAGNTAFGYEYSLTINPPPPLTFTGNCPTSTLPFGSINIPAAASGGVAPYNYAGVSPAWVTYDATGGRFTGTPPAAGSYTVSARVIDSNTNTASFSCSITVAQPLGVSGSCPTNSIQGSAITPFTLTASGGVAPYSWTVVSPSWLSLGTASGNTAQFGGTPPGTGPYSVLIRLTDSIGSTFTNFNCSLAVAAQLSLTSTCNANYPFTSISFPVSATGGYTPYAFTASGLTWLSYSGGATSGSLTGTPPAPGSYSTTLGVRDTNGNTSTRACSFTVVNTMSVSGSCPTGSVAGSAITPFTLTVAGGQGPFTWNVSSPSWLTLGSASGNTAQFTGTPPAAGSYSVVITVDDSVGSTQQTYRCSIVVGAALSLTGTCPTSSIPLGGTVNIPVSASGGTGPYTYQAITPTWLSYNVSGGAFTGTPPGAGTYPVTLQVTDSTGATSRFDCSVTVAAALSASGSCPSSASVGTAIPPFTLTASGGAAPYSWSVVSPSWLVAGTPSGSTEQFSGTPTSSGPASVSIRVTDSIGSTAGTFSCTIPVSPALSLTGSCPTTPLPSGSTVSIPVLASGGSGGYTYTTISPAWLSYNPSSGAFTGTPPGPGTYATSFRVTDSSGATATFNCSVTVGSGLTATGTCPSQAYVGTPITPFTLTGSGGQGPYNWTVVSPNWLQPSTATGSTAQFSGTPTSGGTAAVSVQITDAIGSPAGSFSCSIPVGATLTMTGSCPTATFPLGATVSIPVSASGGSGGYTFTSVTPAWLTYNASAGAFTGTPPGAGSYPVTLRVTDSSGAQATFNCTVTVGAALSATGSCPTSGTVGTPITPFTLTAGGGQPPYAWTVISPAWLQAGNASGATAQFSGTPTTAGNAAVSVRLTDGIGTPAGTFTCTIPVQSALSLTGTCPTSTFALGATVSIPVTASGGSGGYTFVSTTATWLSYNANAGAFTGTPPGAGSFPVTLRVTDSSGAQATFSCTVTVGAALSATGTCPTSATAGTAIAPFTLTAAGGQAPYSWAVSSPTWLQVGNASGSTAQLSGTPTAAGSAAVSVRLTDSIGTAAATFSCTIPVQAALSLTGSCQTSNYPAGVPLSIPVQASGGAGGYTFSTVSPTWLTYSASAGAYAGTPPTTGAQALAFRVTDSAGAQANFNCSITVAAGLAISGTCPTTPVVGSQVSFTLSAQGGTGPFTWAVVAPSWLQIAANGGATATFTGTPPSTGAVDINITVTDSIQSPLARFNCRTTVQGRLQISGSCATRPYPTGLRLDVPVQATGGTGNYTYRVNSPNWLSYQASTSSVGGIPPAAGSYPVSVTATDSSGAQATFTCTIVVAVPLTLSGTCPARAPSDVPFGLSLTAQGGTAPYSFSVLYPNWLQVRTVRGNAADFVGQPAAGGGDITILASDSLGSAATPFTCRVEFEAPPAVPPLKVTGSCQTTSYPAGVRVEIPVQLAGGNGENAFKNISPSWLTYDVGRGKLVGTPPAAGTYNISALASDGTGLQSTFGCSISVAPALTATGVCQDSVITGSALEVPVSVQGGTGPYQWTVVSPSWLHLSNTAGSTATLTGTAPAAGSVELQVRVVDSIQSLPATFGCGIKVNFPPLKVDPPPIQTIPAGSGCPTEPVPAGQALSLPFSVSGGSGIGYRWTLGPAPSWMSLTALTGTSTAIVGEAPGDGVAYVVGVTVTDDAGNVFRPSQCSFRTLEALKVQTAPGDIVVGVPWILPVTGSGGVGPYQWTLSGPAWLSLSSTSGPSTTVVGTPPDARPFSCRVTFQDSVGSKPQSYDCSSKAALAPLSVNIVSTACPTDPLVFGQAFAGQLRAIGGDENYTWTVNGPPWLRSAPSGALLALSGNPDLIQEYTYTVDLADGSGSAPARYSCTLRVLPPGIPTLAMTLVSGATVLDPVAVTLDLSAPAPITLTGEAELSFAPNAFGATDNPQVQFLEPPGQRRVFTFQIPEGSRSVVLGKFQPGTVAGVASVTLTDLRGGGVSLLPGRSAGQVTIPVLPPVLTEVAFESETANGFTIVVTGYSTPRTLTSAAVTFNPKPGTQLTGSSGFTIDLTETSRTYYQTAESQVGGSTFVLRFPVTISGSKGDIASVSVVFTNSAGQSTTTTRDR